MGAFTGFAEGLSDPVTDKVENHVWLDLRNEQASVSPSGNFEGVILSKEHFNKFSQSALKELIVVLEFDANLDLDNHSLPKATTLEALPKSGPFTEFAKAYTNLLSNLGVDYLLVAEDDRVKFPKTIKALENVNEHQLFLNREDLADLQDIEKKKELVELFKSDGILIYEKKDQKKLEKLLKKVRKERFTLSQFLKKDILETEANFSPQLLTKIYEASVSHFQSDKVALPVVRKELGFISPYGNSPLESELEKYFVVEDVTEIPPKEGEVIIMDARSSPEIFQPFIDQYQDHHIIALVSPDSKDEIEADEFLYFPEHHPVHDILAAHMIYGAVGVQGEAAISFLHHPQIHLGKIAASGKLRYAPAIWEGMDETKLKRVDNIATELIKNAAAPGCQITVVKGSSIVYDRAFGYLTYDSLIEVQNTTLYDLASITKVTATLLAVMDLYDKNRIFLNDSISKYLPEYVNTNKSHITLKHLLSHQSGLRAYDALWKKTFDGDFLEPFSYYDADDEENDVRLYGAPVHPVMADSIRSWLKNSPMLKDQDRYRYSDLGFMMLQQVVEEVTGMSLENYVFEKFYQPLGLHYTAFNPLEKGYEIFEIAPTEFDYVYRKELIWGKVHDRNAAIFGGVAGHAGLFSNARDLGVLLKMVLNDGVYAGKSFFKPETIAEFNRKYFDGNRRALGWDKYDPKVGNASDLVSSESFGHTGFTGTMVWADPEHDLIFTFVSNRIYPEASNYRLQRNNYREKIQTAVYESFLSPE